MSTFACHALDLGSNRISYVSHPPPNHVLFFSAPLVKALSHSKSLGLHAAKNNKKPLWTLESSLSFVILHVYFQFSDVSIRCFVSKMFLN